MTKPRRYPTRVDSFREDLQSLKVLVERKGNRFKVTQREEATAFMFGALAGVDINDRRHVIAFVNLVGFHFFLGGKPGADRTYDDYDMLKVTHQIIGSRPAKVTPNDVITELCTVVFQDSSAAAVRERLRRSINRADPDNYSGARRRFIRTNAPFLRNWWKRHVASRASKARPNR